MTMNTTYPSLYQLNTRARLHERGEALGRAGHARRPRRRRARSPGRGRLRLGVAARRLADRRGRPRGVARASPTWQAEYRARAAATSAPDDVAGSPFAVRDYTVHRDFGGDAALARLRRRLAKRGLRLLLDFVPNHMALDHPWVGEHPEYYIQGTRERPGPRAPELDAASTRARARACSPTGATRTSPAGRTRCSSTTATRACARRWSQVLARRRRAVRRRALRHGDAGAARRLPAHLGRRAPSPPTARRPWTRRSGRTRSRACTRHRPDFVFMAEVYWDLEWTLQQQGFDYTYDKRLYDRLCAHEAGRRARAPAGRRRLPAALRALPREPRRAARGRGVPAARRTRRRPSITFLAPGLRFFHEGQTTGRRLRTSNHLGRRAGRADRPRAARRSTGACSRCCGGPRCAAGSGGSLERAPAWDGNPTWEQLVAFSWVQERPATARRGQLRAAAGPGLRSRISGAPGWRLESPRSGQPHDPLRAAAERTWRVGASISTCPPGAPTSSTWRRRRWRRARRPSAAARNQRAAVPRLARRERTSSARLAVGTSLSTRW